MRSDTSTYNIAQERQGATKRLVEGLKRTHITLDKKKLTHIISDENLAWKLQREEWGTTSLSDNRISELYNKKLSDHKTQRSTTPVQQLDSSTYKPLPPSDTPTLLRKLRRLIFK